jgi:outer membrane protein assembly factor BamB
MDRRRLGFVVLVALVLLCAIVGSAQAADWPQWHGPTRDGRAAATEPALNSLPKELKPVWRIAVGGGHSSPVVAAGRLLYLDEDGQHEVAHLLDAATGRERWRTPFAERFEDEWGAGPRSTPLLDGDRAYVQSCGGEFRCLSLAGGKVLWGASFEKNFGVKFHGARGAESLVAARRGNNGSPVVDGDAVIVPVGSTNGASLVSFDKSTGQVRWKAGNEDAAYSSPVIATLAGVRQVVYLSADSLSGFERGTGRLLWRQPLRTAARRHAATPVVVGDTVIANSHTFGTAGFRITRSGDAFTATEAWTNPTLKINLATPVLAEGHLFSQGPDRDYVCVEATTGRLKWSQPGFGQSRRDYASTILLGKRLLVLTEPGTLCLLAVDAERYTELRRLQVCGNTWSSPALADGRLFVRDGRQLRCLDLAGRR